MSYKTTEAKSLAQTIKDATRVFGALMADYSRGSYLSLMCNRDGSPFMLSFGGKTFFCEDGEWYEYVEVDDGR
ncbi:MAG: hypothetical protein J6S36_03730 [Eggerthellaceae bacterium]|nr:hypothetical protein [Eggerthellaceae bacterium]